MASEERAAFGALGLQLEVLSGNDGAGARPRAGQTVSFKYSGRLNDASGPEFDSGSLSVRVGRSQAIMGFDVALPHVAVGQTVRLTLPPVLAYGRKGKPPSVPPNSTLCFEITLDSIEPSTPDSELLDAAATGDVGGILRALSQGASIDHADRKGATSLILAASAGHSEAMLHLLEGGATVDAAQTQPAGVTALMRAVQANDALCVRILLHARADPLKATPKGNSASSLARALPPHLREQLASGQAEPSSPSTDPDNLGIGRADMGAGWESLRCQALWESAALVANPRCWLRFACAPLEGGDQVARADGEMVSSYVVEVELWAHLVPRTAENFRCLCTGEKGHCTAFGSPPLHCRRRVKCEVYAFGSPPLPTVGVG